MSLHNDNRPGDGAPSLPQREPTIAELRANAQQVHAEMLKHLEVLKEATVEALRLQREAACYRNALQDIMETSGDQRAIALARFALARGASIP